MRTINDLLTERAAVADLACFVRQEPLAAYLAEAHYVSASMLRQAMLSGAPLRAAHIKNDSCQRLAQALHALVLEPARFARDYLVLDGDPDVMTTADDPDALDRAWLSGGEYAALAAARDAIRAYARASLAQHLEDGLKELSIYWTDEEGQRWKARPDCFTDGVVLELKTTVDVRPHAFAQTRRRFGYDLKAAHYVEAVGRLTGTAPRFAYLAVELAAPHYVWVHELSATELARAARELISAKARFRGAPSTAAV